MVKSLEAVEARKRYQRDYRQKKRDENRIDYNRQMAKYRQTDRHFKWRFGLTREDFQARLESQNFLCLICLRPFDLTGSKFGALSPVVDHDHACCPSVKSCGKCIRGILHRSCNMGIGQLGDNPAILRLAAEYLEAHNGNQSE